MWRTHTSRARVCIKYTKGQDGLEIKSTIDLVLVKKDMLRYVQDEAWDGDSQITMLHLLKVRLVGT